MQQVNRLLPDRLCRRHRDSGPPAALDPRTEPVPERVPGCHPESTAWPTPTPAPRAASRGDVVDDEYGEPFERFDPVSGLPLPEDDNPELSAALADWQAAWGELRELS